MKLHIKGLGICSPYGTSYEEIVTNYSKERISNYTYNHIKKKNLRRINHFSKILLKSFDDVIESSGLDFAQYEPSRCGAISNTCYGPLMTNIEFAEQVLGGDPDLASPMLFANTVTNGSLGQACIAFNLKGDSTTIVGSNPISYSELLLKNNNNDIFFVSGIEEANSGLREEYDTFFSKNNEIPFEECAATILLSTSEDLSDKGIILETSDTSLTWNPYFETLEQHDVNKEISGYIEQWSQNVEGINYAVLSSVDSRLCKAEKAALSANNITRHLPYKDYIGQTHGADIVACTVMFLSDPDIRVGEKVMILHTDMSANYSCVVVEKR